MNVFAGDSNVYRATSSLAGRQLATSGFTRHVIELTTSLPDLRPRGNVNSMPGLSDDDDDDDDEDYHDEMTSFGSGNYDNNDDAVRHASSMKTDSDDRVLDVWQTELLSSSSSSSSSSQSQPSLHADDLDSPPDDDQQQGDVGLHLKDISRTLSTTPAVRTRLRDPGLSPTRRGSVTVRRGSDTVSTRPSLSPTRRGSVERRRPAPMVTSSSSAARRRYYVDNMATSGATFHVLTSSLLCCVAAAILCSCAHVFLLLPVLRSSVC